MVSRQELYELVWSTPMTKVAEQFEVSNSYMARVCTALNVPRPGRGHWAKLAVGEAPRRLPLPEPRPGDQLSWEPGGELSPVAKFLSRQEDEPLLGSRSQSRAHWLVNSARQHFDACRPGKEGDYLKPYKKLLVDVTSSKACLEKAFGFASVLFNALEAAGHRVVLAQRMHRIEIDEKEVQSRHPTHRYPSLWTPREPTVVFIGEVPIGLAIIEMSEEVLMRYVNGEYIRDAEYKPPRTSRYSADRTWTTTSALPSGRLRLIAYCPSWRVSWSTQWQETAKSPLQNSIGVIVKGLQGSANDLAEKMAEAERIAEAKHQEQLAAIERHKREEDRRKIEQSVKDSRDHIEQIIQQWANIKGIEQFLTGVEQQAATLPPDERRAVLQRLEMASEFLGSRDPMKYFMEWKTPTERYESPYASRSDSRGNE